MSAREVDLWALLEQVEHEEAVRAAKAAKEGRTRSSGFGSS